MYVSSIFLGLGLIPLPNKLYAQLLLSSDVDILLNGTEIVK